MGDFLLDTYTMGRVKRISPEAPVPVMEAVAQESRPGGAGNVVLNLLALGGTVFAMGRIGTNFEAEQLKNHLSQSDTSALFVEKGYNTPVKNRLIADHQQLLRIDFETLAPLSSALEEMCIKRLKTLLAQVQVVAISDYGKGFLTDRLIATTIKMAKEMGVPVVVDPKGNDFTKYRGASVIKPNLSEAYAAAKCPAQFSLDEVAKALLDLTDTLLITRSEAGISIFKKNGARSDFPVRSKEVIDVTGAGDTVLAMVCLGIANGLDMECTAQLANIAASLSVERVGCVQVTLSQLAKRLWEYDSDTKIFDENHTFALHQILKDRLYSLLVLEKGQTMTTGLFRAIRQLASETGKELILYVRDSHPEDAFIHMLSSLQEVDYIILQTESLKNLCSAITPNGVYLLKQDKMASSRKILDSLLCSTQNLET